VAARCTVQIDRRWTPGESVEQVFAELETILARVRSENPGLMTELRRLPGSMATMIHGPLETEAGHPLVRAALDARQEATGAETSPESFPAWSDAALLSREAGIPCVVMGPGHLAQAHSSDEWVSIAQVEEAALQYAILAGRFCGMP
jgi:acetylornithine deacetylase/succinyl-diaminopimelate desuccinylase-like protein